MRRLKNWLKRNWIECKNNWDNIWSVQILSLSLQNTKTLNTMYYLFISIALSITPSKMEAVLPEEIELKQRFKEKGKPSKSVPYYAKYF